MTVGEIAAIAVRPTVSATRFKLAASGAIAKAARGTRSELKPTLLLAKARRKTGTRSDPGVV